jgi:hypothetical protein
MLRLKRFTGRRERMLGVQLHDHEYQQIAKAALTLKLRPSTWARDVLNDAARRRIARATKGAA